MTNETKIESIKMTGRNKGWEKNKRKSMFGFCRFNYSFVIQKSFFKSNSSSL